MKVSVIIAVYKDYEALDLIIEALKAQTYKNFEVIIAEDCNDAKMKDYITNIKDIKIQHLSQEDSGWRKNIILNQAIISSTSEYLIFIDGDCVPHEKFVEEHLRLREDNVVLCGRRTEPGEYFSTLLRTKQMTIGDFSKSYLKNYFKLKKDNIRHYEDGIYCDNKSFLGKLADKKGKRKEAHIVGCHWSCNKDDLLKINGFDEDFTLPTTGEDTDIERRLRHFGVKMKSCRNFAILIHLYHKKVFNPEITTKTLNIMNSKLDQFICKNGVKKYE